MKILAPLDLSKNEIQNAKLQKLGTDPAGLAAGDSAQFWFNTTDGRAKIWSGGTIDTLTNIIESVIGSGSVTVSVSGKQVTVGVQGNSANTANTLVQRDASGNFSAATITAALTGTASNAAALSGQTLAQVRDLAQTTGARDHTAISDFDNQVRTSPLNLMATPTGPVAMNSQRITGMADPTGAQDAASKAYVDSVVQGLDVKASVRATTSVALPANTYANGNAGVGATLTGNGVGSLLIDGVALNVNDRLLVKNEATAANNGIYVVTTKGDGSTAWQLTRATDADKPSELNGGVFTFVEEGTVRAATGWVLTTTGAVTLGSTSITFSQFSGAGTYTAGNGLALTGTSFAVTGVANRISVSGSGVDIASTYVGQTSINTLGTIGTGTWQGTAVGIAYGGTSATTALGARANLGAIGKASALVPAGTSYAFAHNLNTQDVDVVLRDATTNALVQADYVATDVNTVTVTFGSAVAANAYRVTVQG